MTTMTTMRAATTSGEERGQADDCMESLDAIVICGLGDLRSFGNLAGEVRGVESVGVSADRIRAVVRPGPGVLARLIDLAETCKIDIELVFVARHVW